MPKYNEQLESFVYVRIFSNYVGLEFGIEKCTVFLMRQGRVEGNRGYEMSAR